MIKDYEHYLRQNKELSEQEIQEALRKNRLGSSFRNGKVVRTQFANLHPNY